MLEALKFNSPGKFFIAVGTTLIVWSVSFYFILVDKHLPLEFDIYKEKYIADANYRIELAKEKSNSENLIHLKAELDAAKFKVKEMGGVIKYATYVQNYAINFGGISIILGTFIYILEIFSILPRKASIQTANKPN